MTDRKTPSTGLKRPLVQSQDERDVAGYAARRERDRGGTVRDAASEEEVTGRYEGEELDERRAKRPPDQRFSRLESKHDDLKRDVDRKHDELSGEIKDVRDELKADVKDVRDDLKRDVRDARTDVREMRKEVGGKITEVLGLVKKSAERETTAFTAKVDIDKAFELAKVEVSRAAGLATVEVSKEQGLDVVSAGKARREAIARFAGGVLGGGGIVELLHRLGVL